MGYTIFIIRDPQNSIGNYSGRHIKPMQSFPATALSPELLFIVVSVKKLHTCKHVCSAGLRRGWLQSPIMSWGLGNLRILFGASRDLWEIFARSTSALSILRMLGKCRPRGCECIPSKSRPWTRLPHDTVSWQQTKLTAIKPHKPFGTSRGAVSKSLQRL